MGNQLFQYFAGLKLALDHDCALNLIEYKNSKGLLLHGSSIRDFQIPNTVSTLDCAPDGRFFEKIQHTSQHRFPLISKLLMRRYSHYRSNVLGFDPNLDFLKPSVMLSGYFQSYKYFESVVFQRPEMSSLELVASTSTFRELLNLIHNFSTTAIHVRRGDYVKISSEVGLLDANYYHRALTEIGGEVEKFLVFSDDIDEARNLLGMIPKIKIVFVSTALPAVESLKLMSLCDKVVTANSSFSFWGAMMGQKKSLVLAPKKWFRGEDDPQELKPRSWIEIESSWVN